MSQISCVSLLAFVAILLLTPVVQCVEAPQRANRNRNQKQAILVQEKYEDKLVEMSFQELIDFDASHLICETGEQRAYNERLQQRVEEVLEFLRDDPAEKLRQSIVLLEEAAGLLERARIELEEFDNENNLDGSDDDQSEIDNEGRAPPAVFLSRLEDNEEVLDVLSRVDAALFPEMAYQINEDLNAQDGGDMTEVIQKLGEVIDLIHSFKQELQEVLDKGNFEYYNERLQVLKADIEHVLQQCEA